MISFLLAIFIAVVIYFALLFIASAVPFWWPEIAWGAQFLLTVIFIEFLSGALFPLDVLPEKLFAILSYTPFPYLIFFPIEVYLGKIPYPLMAKGLIVSAIWGVFLIYLMKRVWGKGMKVYQSHGR
jgi:ABC-2 type transport system permease protein